jgi:hypothetical protein
VRQTVVHRSSSVSGYLIAGHSQSAPKPLSGASEEFPMLPAETGLSPERRLTWTSRAWQPRSQAPTRTVGCPSQPVPVARLAAHVRPGHAEGEGRGGDPRSHRRN